MLLCCAVSHITNASVIFQQLRKRSFSILPSDFQNFIKNKMITITYLSNNIFYQVTCEDHGVTWCLEWNIICHMFGMKNIYFSKNKWAINSYFPHTHTHTVIAEIVFQYLSLWFQPHPTSGNMIQFLSSYHLISSM